MYHVLPGNTLEKHLRKSISHLTNMITSLTNPSLAYLEFKDESQILFSGGNNDQLYALLRSFKDDLVIKTQKAVKLRHLKDKGGWANFQVNTVTLEITTTEQMLKEE